MMQKFLYAMIFGVSFFLISCMPPRINTVRFDLVYSEMENHHRLRLDHIYIEKPDASALTKEANGDTILRILEIPDFSPSFINSSLGPMWPIGLYMVTKRN